MQGKAKRRATACEYRNARSHVYITIYIVRVSEGCTLQVAHMIQHQAFVQALETCNSTSYRMYTSWPGMVMATMLPLEAIKAPALQH